MLLNLKFKTQGWKDGSEVSKSALAALAEDSRSLDPTPTAGGSHPPVTPRRRPAGTLVHTEVQMIK